MIKVLLYINILLEDNKIMENKIIELPKRLFD